MLEPRPTVPAPSALHVIAVSVGNSRIKYGLYRGLVGEPGAAIPVDRAAEAAAAIAALAKKSPGARVVVASVNPPVSDPLCAALDDDTGVELYRVGEDLPIPIVHALDDDSTVGQDRLLTALGAFARFQQACVVIDAGTAITVNFVDGEGTFQGGVIAPGVRMMLRALHEQTAALPPLDFALPDATRGPFGKDTAHAMLLGVLGAARGLVRYQIERYAEAYGGYPKVVATGGDADQLFAGDELVEHLIPDLQLVGIAAACARVAEFEDE